MSRYRLIAVFAVLLGLIAGCAIGPAPTATPVSPTATAVPPTATPVPRKVLLLMEEASGDMDFMLTNESGVMVSMLEKAGFKVVVASESGQPLGSGATTLRPDLKSSDVKTADYVGVILPCMAKTTMVPPPHAVAIVREAVALGRPVAAQFGGVLTLDAAGALKDKKFATFADAKGTISNGTYVGEGVVQDGNIITSGICPEITKMMGKVDGTPALTQKFIDLLVSVR